MILAGHGAQKDKIEEFLTAVCICHDGQRALRHAQSETEKQHFKSIYPEDVAQL
jgi:hypothetical protein